MSYKVNQPMGFIGDGYESDPYHSMLPYQHQQHASLGQVTPPAPPIAIGIGGAGITVRQVIIGLVVIAIIGLLLRQLNKANRSGQKIERNDVMGRVSTKELAQRLYERLEKKGRANPATMRSLERIGR